ncbi:MAG: NrtR DNA-binding winged helix domain-containing protein [Ferrimicrobium sp.]
MEPRTLTNDFETARSPAVVATVVVLTMREGSPHLLVTTNESDLHLPNRLITTLSVPITLQVHQLLAQRAGIVVDRLEQIVTGEGPATATTPGGAIHVTYLGLTAHGNSNASAVTWTPLYDLMPWEDQRGETDAFVPFLPTAVLTRLAYHRLSNTLVGPLCRMSPLDQILLATAIERLRSALTYRPVVFDLIAPTFTLRALQTTIEALQGVSLHSQNFRRLVLEHEVVEPIGVLANRGPGRPAELFRFRDSATKTIGVGFNLPRRLRIG